MSAKPTHCCPLCKGTGKVTKKIAEARISVRDRAKYNATMRLVNEKARQRKKGVAT